MADTDSFSSIFDLPDHLPSKYAALGLTNREGLPPTKDQESNSEGIIKALKALQEKLRQLELEKSATLKKFERLKDVSQAAGSFPPAKSVEISQPPKSRKRHSVKSAPPPASYGETPSRTSSAKVRFDHRLPVGHGSHYHLNYRDIPFIIGMSTTPSHSLIANYQHMLSLMKSHGPLCRLPAYGQDHNPTKKHSVALAELSTLLTNLQDEVQRLSSEYQHLSSQRSQYDDISSSRREYRLKVIQNKLRSKLDKMAELCHRSVSSCEESPRHFYGLDPKDAQLLQSPRNLLKTMKQVQKTLQSNDLQWQ